MKSISLNFIGKWFSISGSIMFVGFSIYLFYIDDNLFRAAMGMISALTLLVPRLLYNFFNWHKNMTRNVLGVIELIVGAELAFNGIGSLGFYLGFQNYDTVLHTVMPLITGIGLALIVESYLHSRNILNLRTIQVTTVVPTFILIFIWEFWEWGADQAFNTNMFGQPGERLDTVYDIIAGTVAMIILFFLNRYFYKRFLPNQTK